MYIIAGLGNPGKEYENTRHNIGFDCIDRIAERCQIPVLERKWKAMTGRGYLAGQKVILLKPLTYMNLSGESIRAAVDYYKADSEKEVIVLCDDINLPPGQLRIRSGGSAGGHNGLKNIISRLGHENFARIRIGVGGKPERADLADYVLGHFSKEQRRIMDEAAADAADAAELMLTEGIGAAMNRYNGRKG